MRSFGLFFIIMGLIWGIIAFNMTTAVQTESRTFGSGEYSVNIPSQTVHNLDLAEKRHIHLMISGLFVIVGTILFCFGSIINSSISNSVNSRKCPRCAELIKSEAKVCRFCNFELTSVEPIQNILPKVEVIITEKQWKCPKCGEIHDNEFDSCWSCGTEKS